MPGLYIITGANGAGKSTVGSSYLPKHIQKKYEIFDGDKLFMRKHRELYHQQKINLKEARHIATEWLYNLFDELSEKALENFDHFVYEGHLPEEELWNTPKKFKQAGYKIHVIYFGLENTDLAELRVMDRAKHGGHNVPPYEIQRNYYGNLKMLNIHYELIDDLKIIDTSESVSPRLLIHLKNGKIVNTASHLNFPDWFALGLPDIFKLIVHKENS